VWLTTVALAAVAGCSGGAGRPAAGASATTSAGAAAGGEAATGGGAAQAYRAQVLPLGRHFAQCARQNGKPNFPDPIFNRDGALDFPNAAKGDFEDLVVNPSSPCRKIMRQIYVVGAPPPARLPSPALFALLQQYARCQREHGVPEYPDPERDGSDPFAGTDLNFILNFGPVPQRMIDARNACTRLEDELRVASRRG
jgi:hypothetical protein